MTGREILDRAAAGELPDWTEATPARRKHMDRVATLMARWADGLGLDRVQRTSWIAAGRLHDVLRDADASVIEPWLPAAFRDLPFAFHHGPAAAARLEAEGVSDDAVLDAIRYHTLGSGRLGPLGRALIAADFLEPGRRQSGSWRAIRRARMPDQLDAVVADVVRKKLAHGLESGTRLRPEMVDLWNTLVRQ